MISKWIDKVTKRSVFMKRNIFLLLFSFLVCVSGTLQAQLTIDMESGLAFQNYNKVRIPNEGATLFRFNEEFELQGPVIPIRVRLGYTFSEKNHIFILWAPLGINYEGVAPRTINFQGSIFREGLQTDGFYKFNSYRITYRRDFINNDKWTLGLGFTAKIRDASVQLENEEGVSARKDNRGFVPLLHLYVEYQLSGFSLYFEGDGLAGGPGRAFDLFLGAKVPLSSAVALKGGYRFLEGGADVNEVYNFTLVQYAVAGLFITL